MHVERNSSVRYILQYGFVAIIAMLKSAIAFAATRLWIIWKQLIRNRRHDVALLMLLLRKVILIVLNSIWETFVAVD